MFNATRKGVKKGENYGEKSKHSIDRCFINSLKRFNCSNSEPASALNTQGLTGKYIVNGVNDCTLPSYSGRGPFILESVQAEFHPLNLDSLPEKLYKSCPFRELKEMTSLNLREIMRDSDDEEQSIFRFPTEKNDLYTSWVTTPQRKSPIIYQSLAGTKRAYATDFEVCSVTWDSKVHYNPKKLNSIQFDGKISASNYLLQRLRSDPFLNPEEMVIKDYIFEKTETTFSFSLTWKKEQQKNATLDIKVTTLIDGDEAQKYSCKLKYIGP